MVQLGKDNMLLESIGFQVTAAAVAGTAGTVFTGDSLTVKNSRAGSRISLLALTTHLQAPGFFQLVYPSAHDTTRGFRGIAPGVTTANIFPPGVSTSLVPQDLISATIGEAGTVGDIAQGVLTLWYEDMPGQAARLITNDDLANRMQRLLTVQFSITAGATGNWTASETLNADSDLLKANTDYAVLGGGAEFDITGFAVSGPDTGNARVFIPCSLSGFGMQCGWFTELGFQFGLATIPVVNSANKGATNIVVTDDENGAATRCFLNLAELSPS